jgi:hypothetical protein
MIQYNARTEITLMCEAQIFKYAFVPSVNCVLILVSSQARRDGLSVGFEVLTAVVVSYISWDITPCSPLKAIGRFEGKYRP